MAELNGEVKDEERITQLDSLPLPAPATAAAPAKKAGEEEGSK